MGSQRLLYFVTEDWYFCSHRMALAQAAQREGFDVTVLTRVDQHGELILNAGIRLIPLNVKRGGVNPITELLTLMEVAKVYRSIKPDLVHHIALKPVLYGGLVALFMPRLKVVNLLAGLGVIFSSRRITANLLRPLVKQLFRILLRRSNSLTVVQNKDDYSVLNSQLAIPDSKLRMIKGSGLDIHRFGFSNEPLEPVAIALVSRLLWDKGVGEYVSAVKFLKQRGLVFKAFLVGKPDPENHSSVDSEQLQAWNDEGYVSCCGYVDDMAGFWRDVHIAVLPSYYGEGVPKCLIEAVSCGRPVVTTDMPGCREIVENGVNGILVPPRDAEALAIAMETLIDDARLRKLMGAAGRQKAEREFSDEIVLTQTLDVYRNML